MSSFVFLQPHTQIFLFVDDQKSSLWMSQVASEYSISVFSTRKAHRRRTQNFMTLLKDFPPEAPILLIFTI